jgi:hypothetical protein
VARAISRSQIAICETAREFLRRQMDAMEKALRGEIASDFEAIPERCLGDADSTEENDWISCPNGVASKVGESASEQT